MTGRPGSSSDPETVSGPGDIFESTTGEYDLIIELSYAWYYARVHHTIAAQVIRPFGPSRVLDLACGTGFQSYLHAAAGASVVGVDLSQNLLAAAMGKKQMARDPADSALFPVHFDFVAAYNRRIDALTAGCRPNPPRGSLPDFIRADGRHLPFPAGRFDHVNLVGGLSYMTDRTAVLEEIRRVLDDDGTLFLEVENRWNVEILWRTLQTLFRNGGSGPFSPADIRRFLMPPFGRGVTAAFPFNAYGEIEPVAGRFFTLREMGEMLRAAGFRILGRWPVHAVTNLIPWSCLERRRPSRRLERLFLGLAALEERLPFFLPGIGLMVLARKGR